MAAPSFTMNRAEVVDRNFVHFCRQLAAGGGAGPTRRADERVYSNLALTVGELRELFESQVVSRHLDLIARELRREGRGYYTIGSSGHEGNVVLGRLARCNDPAFLHYRACALMAERTRQRPDEDFIHVTLLSFMASRLDPIAGGRHKVWGSVPLAVPPQTSTIASHLPRALGAALAIERARRLGITPKLGAHGEIPADSIVLCTFGDATTNHSVAQGAFNACSYWSYRGQPAPVLWVCEDNGIGISVPTPQRWIDTNFRNRPEIRYFLCDGLDLLDAWSTAREAVEYVRTQRKPAFLHMRVVRLLGHAGTDPETEYHSLAQIEADEALDPLKASARLMVDSGCLSAAEVLDLYEGTRKRIRAAADQLGTPPLLTTADEVIKPLAPLHADKVHKEATRPAAPEQRLEAFALDSTPGFLKSGDKPRLPENQPPRHLAVLINWALRDLLAKYGEMHIFGEDVAERGGVYYVTAGLKARFGEDRVFNTLLDETTILGMAIGAGHTGLLPVPEIQYLAYLHNAIDQLRGEACSSQFFSNGQFPNPMVVRIQSLGYQKGFGGHFHNDNSVAAVRDIPSLIVAVPARGDDAAKMLRTCLALAKVDGRVVLFLEPIALYMTKDLYDTGDGKWLSHYPPPTEAIPFGEGQVYALPAGAAEPQPVAAKDRAATSGDEDLTILTFGNGLWMSLRAARTLARDHCVRCRVVDLRWLSPLNEAFIVEQSRLTGRVLVVDEGRRSGGVSEGIMALLLEHCGGEVICARLVGLDTYVPLGPAANTVMPTEEDVVREALALHARSGSGSGGSDAAPKKKSSPARAAK